MIRRLRQEDRRGKVFNFVQIVVRKGERVESGHGELLSFGSCML